MYRPTSCMAPFLEHNCKSCSWPYIDFHNLIRLWDMDQWKVNKLSSCKIKIQMFWCSGIFRRFRTACNQEYLEVNKLHALREDVFQIHLQDQEEEMQQIKLLPRFCFSSCLAFLSVSRSFSIFSFHETLSSLTSVPFIGKEAASLMEFASVLPWSCCDKVKSTFKKLFW